MTTLSTRSALNLTLPAMLMQAGLALVARLQARLNLALARAGTASNSQSLTLTLAKDAFHPIARPLGRTITCESGVLWLTFDHTPADVILEAGESHTCRVDHRLLMMALAGSRARVQ